MTGHIIDFGDCVHLLTAPQPLPATTGRTLTRPQIEEVRRHTAGVLTLDVVRLRLATSRLLYYTTCTPEEVARDREVVAAAWNALRRAA